ncbi:hypothetical protein [Kordiimonas sp. SCSIO 12610]|uniref:hypothetical protein n=1 Tax=Kordiimonas sp. SCSIO 12610 TaxID=2829597 RepID=UPI00210E7B6A|nr:hypothetical protein [Kordiimonas sp. SCSIO 12610]UTW54615.1 hypothetical protein KFF44_12495 [Kordiimonas sp. SCSIO 12610]
MSELLPCPTCNRLISEQAEACPKCGEPLQEGWIEDYRKAKQKSRGRYFGAFIIAILLLPALARLGNKKPNYIAPSETVNEQVGKVFRASEYGEGWPFSNYRSVEGNCFYRKFGNTNRPLVIIRIGEENYGMNGAAMGVGGYPDARKFIPRDPEFGVYDQKLYPTYGKIFEATKELCDPPINITN